METVIWLVAVMVTWMLRVLAPVGRAADPGKAIWVPRPLVPPR